MAEYNHASEASHASLSNNPIQFGSDLSLLGMSALYLGFMVIALGTSLAYWRSTKQLRRRIGSYASLKGWGALGKSVLLFFGGYFFCLSFPVTAAILIYADATGFNITESPPAKNMMITPAIAWVLTGLLDMYITHHSRE